MIVFLAEGPFPTTVLVTGAVISTLLLILLSVVTFKFKSTRRMADEIKLKELNKERKARGEESIDYREIMNNSRTILYRDQLDNYNAANKILY